MLILQVSGDRPLIGVCSNFIVRRRIKNLFGAERSATATRFFVELSRLPGNLEFNQEGLLIQE
jgi:hypothetical protein